MKTNLQAQRVTERKVLAKATEELGTREAAKVWLRAPSMALDYQRPADLLSTPAGAESVERLLAQMEYCVYI